MSQDGDAQWIARSGPARVEHILYVSSVDCMPSSTYCEIGNRERFDREVQRWMEMDWGVPLACLKSESIYTETKRGWRQRPNSKRNVH